MELLRWVAVAWRMLAAIACVLLLIACFVWTVTENNTAYLLGVPLLGYWAWLAVFGDDD